MTWLRRYAAHPDPATAAMNLVALVIAGNGPFYPLYVLALIGRDVSGTWLTMLATPAFAAVPALARRHPAAGRACLPLIGTLNTVWCAYLCGSATAMGLFLLPCAILAGSLFRPEERWLRLALLLGIVATQIALTEHLMPGLLVLDANDAAALARLNTISATTLTAFLSICFANLLRELRAQVVPPNQSCGPTT